MCICHVSTLKWNLLFIHYYLDFFKFPGRGQFGDVYTANALNIRNGAAETTVVVKSLLSLDKTEQAMFREEIDMFEKANYESVVRLLAVSGECQPLLAIYEYTEWVGI